MTVLAILAVLGVTAVLAVIAGTVIGVAVNALFDLLERIRDR